MKPKLLRGGYVKVARDCIWPVPFSDEMNLAMSNLAPSVLKSIAGAYAVLVSLPRREREVRVRQLRQAMDATTRQRRGRP